MKRPAARPKAKARVQPFRAPPEAQSAAVSDHQMTRPITSQSVLVCVTAWLSCLVCVCEMGKNKPAQVFEDGGTYNCPICQKLIREGQEMRMLGPVKMDELFDRIEVRSGQCPDNMYFHQWCLLDGTYPSNKDAGKLLWTSKLYF